MFRYPKPATQNHDCRRVPLEHKGFSRQKTFFKPYGCFLKRWYPQNIPKWSFLVGQPMVVGYHHFRKPPYGRGIYSPTGASIQDLILRARMRFRRFSGIWMPRIMRGKTVVPITDPCKAGPYDGSKWSYGAPIKWPYTLVIGVITYPIYRSQL